MVTHKLRAAIVAIIIAAGSIVGGVGAVSFASSARSFSLTGTLMLVNTNTHRISVQVRSTRHSIVVTPATKVFLQNRRASVASLRTRLRTTVTIRGIMRAKWREALLISAGTAVAPLPRPIPANTSLDTALRAALQREQYALGTYQNVVGRLGSSEPFTNVIAGEQQHVSTLKGFFSEYHLSLPTNLVTGAPAPATRTEACSLAVSIEHTLVRLYDEQLPMVASYADVHHAFENFRTVSLTNHLPAFERCA